MRQLSRISFAIWCIVALWVTIDAYTRTPAPPCFPDSVSYDGDPVGLRRIHWVYFAWNFGFWSIWIGFSRLYMMKPATDYVFYILEIVRDVVWWLVLTVFIAGMYILWQATVLENNGGCTQFGGTEIDNNNTQTFVAFMLAWSAIPILLISSLTSLIGVFFLRFITQETQNELQPPQL